MKKSFKILTAIIFGIGLFLQGMTCTAFAAEVPASSVKESQFVTGLFGSNNDGDEIVVALYNTGKQDIAFIADGNKKFYGTYTVAPEQRTGATYAERFNVSGVTFTYFESGNGRYIITDDDVIYVLDNITAYEVEQMR
ncbi:hypothetical protein [Butyrivibrio sp. AE3004]|uniref:hypothetical protein n=1 Tax=Butyrivibrio sp. AE3004 TaxID=1506994 RepID=UPI000493E8D4|nr:hypothetical protein [Butyrivibrio sp. AE3004]